MTSPKDLAQSQISLLSEFLGPTIQSTPSRTMARQKLQKLNDAQFSELSTDVYDEVLRRKTEPIVPFLPINESFHPKRNQARQKLSTLPESRFVDLASDVYVEMLKRFPNLAVSREQVEDKRESLPPRSVGASLTPIQPSVEKNLHLLESETTQETNKKMMELKKEWTTKENEYQEQIRRLNQELQESKKRQDSLSLSLDKMEKERNEYKSKWEQSQSNLVQLQSSKQEFEKLKLNFKDMETKYKKLNDENEGLKEDFQTQEQMLVAIRSEATNLLDEIKRLTRANQELVKANQELKSGQNSIKTIPSNAVPSTQPTSQGVLNKKPPPLTIQSTKIDPVSVKKEEVDFDPSSIVPNDRIQAYKNAISELNSETKAVEASGVLFAMKKVVLACKSITEFIEAKEGDKDLTEIKKDLSMALTKLMESAKAHVTVSNKNSAQDITLHSEQLTRVVVELVNAIKIDSSSTEIMGGGDDSVDIMNDYIHSPTHATVGPLKSMEELKGFLEQQTDGIVQSIQTLLNAMRQSGPYGNDFTHLVDSITSSVDKVIQESKSADLPLQMRQRVDKTIQELTSVNSQIHQLSQEMISTTPTKILKQKMASSTYEVARHVKDLLNLLD